MIRRKLFPKERGQKKTERMSFETKGLSEGSRFGIEEEFKIYKNGTRRDNKIRKKRRRTEKISRSS